MLVGLWRLEENSEIWREKDDAVIVGRRAYKLNVLFRARARAELVVANALLYFLSDAPDK